MKIRTIEGILRKFAKQYPIVTITGPRQSGKTTISKTLFPEKDYVTLENLDVREFAKSDPKGFLRQYRNGAVFDEFQKSPELASYLQTEVDSDSTPGRFILTGSGQFELMESVSQSLAGRTAILRLLPFSLTEAYGHGMFPDLNTTLYTGFYPRIFDKNLHPTDMYSFYTDTYLEKDVRNLLNVKDLSRFEIFLKLCAGRSGQELNLNQLGNDCGVTHNTIKSWITVLEASFIIKLVQPYYKNIGKRLTKTPKLYFIDTGLLCFLLGIKEPDHLAAHPLRGSIFETFVVSEIIKSRFNSARNHDLYFLRDSKGHEVDLVLDGGAKISLLEIKSSQTIASDFFRNLHYFQKIISDVQHCYCVYGGVESRVQSDTRIVPWVDAGTLQY
ncbi:MAG: ATP-binding protein [Leptospiraceae bacterium]|nr:ATP-binding protein [Leptospiraceae bacterium]MCB1200616.1 ATP-binding protein [Leptospiraceae bacterium]